MGREAGRSLGRILYMLADRRRDGRRGSRFWTAVGKMEYSIESLVVVDEMQSAESGRGCGLGFRGRIMCRLEWVCNPER
jgi:hypothetical protein